MNLFSRHQTYLPNIYTIDTTIQLIQEIMQANEVHLKGGERIINHNCLLIHQ